MRRRIEQHVAAGLEDGTRRIKGEYRKQAVGFVITERFGQGGSCMPAVLGRASRLQERIEIDDCTLRFMLHEQNAPS